MVMGDVDWRLYEIDMRRDTGGGSEVGNTTNVGLVLYHKCTGVVWN